MEDEKKMSNNFFFGFFSLTIFMKTLTDGRTACFLLYTYYTDKLESEM